MSVKKQSFPLTTKEPARSVLLAIAKVTGLAKWKKEQKKKEMNPINDWHPLYRN